MKGYKIRAAVLALACIMALPMTGCTKSGEVASLTSEELEAVQQKDLEINAIGTQEVLITGTTPAETTAPPVATTPAVSTVTDASGNTFVYVTDTQGTTVTQQGGAAVTQPYIPPITTTATTEAGGSTTTTTTAQNNDTYTAMMETRQALWWNISRKSDYVFDGQFLKFNFKVKDSTKDGNYEIRITHADFSNYAANTLDVKTQNGYITVGNATPVTPPAADGSGFLITASSAQAKPGDTVEIIMNMKNNPGFAGLDFQFQYDTNALEFVDGGYATDFQNAIK